MNFAYLKKVRIVVSLVVLCLLLILFLDIKPDFLKGVADFLMRLQLIPSIFRFLALFFAVSGLGFLLVLVLTWLVGRVYCSSICPLGTLQDMIIAISRVFKKKKNRKFAYSGNQKNLLRYGVLGATLTLWIAGSLFLINLLDPFSNFGKISVTFFKPTYIWLNNQLAFLLERFYIYAVDPLAPVSMPLEAILVSAVIILTLIIMTTLRGRLFCNTLCPAGSMLSLVARHQIFKITFNEEACNHCGRCEKVCKAECLNSKTKTIDHSRCVGCFNCFEACSNRGLFYSRKPALKAVTAPAGNVQAEKRKFLLTLTTLVLSIPLLRNSTMAKGFGRPGLVPTGTVKPIIPPGAISLDHFTSHCTACYLCVSKCPKNVIIPTLFDHGLQGIMQPKLDFHKSFCNFDCVICTEVCPSGAITPQTLVQKQTIQIGVAIFMVESCIVTINRTECGACSEHCPTKAVNMVEWEGLWLPEVTPELCIGCGACEFACPTYPYKAIFVESNPVHKQAIPIEESEGPREDILEEFPF
ncbi:MAG TPA: 4Fe-4S binding protein [Bacteroidales bacterium]|nr:4Fe-4S binding protein [Bacteroidales bacterium]